MTFRGSPSVPLCGFFVVSFTILGVVVFVSLVVIGLGELIYLKVLFQVRAVLLGVKGGAHL